MIPYLDKTLGDANFKSLLKKNFANDTTHVGSSYEEVIAARDFETRPQVTPADCQPLLMISAKQLWKHGQIFLQKIKHIFV